MKKAIMLLLTFIIVCNAAAVELYISPDGSDTNEGTKASPLQTIHKAVSLITQMRQNGKLNNKPLTILLSKGTYYLNETINLADMAGTEPTETVTFMSMNGHKVTISGALAVNHWKKYRGQIYMADLSGKAPLNVFRELYYNNERQHLARTPNFDSGNPHHGGFAYVSKDSQKDTNTTIHYDPSQVNPGKWAKPEQAHINIFVYPNYGNKRAKVNSIDRSNSAFTIDPEGFAGIPKENDRFYFYNIFEELDAPGEWYFDTEKQILYFYPPNGQRPLDGEVTIPQQNTLVKFNGQAGKSIQNIGIEGIEFAGCTETAIELQYARNCWITGCKIYNTGLSGIRNGIDCKHNRFISNDIYDTGKYGILLIGEAFKHHRNSHNSVINNHIYDIGKKSCMEVAGIYIITGEKNRIANNHIHDTPRWGIGINVAGENIIEYNHVHHTNHSTEDAGIINTVTSWSGWDNHFDPEGNDHIEGNIIRFNLLHDSGGYGRVAKWMHREDFEKGKYLSPYFSWGIYLDLASSGTQVYGNIVYNCFMGAVIIGGGENNIVTNNIFVDNEISQVYTCKWSDHFPMKCNVIERNIICYDNPRAELYRNTSQHGKTWSPINISYNHNLIFPGKGDMFMALHGYGPANWEKWLETGMDKDSVISDPMFIDPAKNDYRLKPQSPAFAIGFEKIPTEKIGLYKDNYRKQLP